MNIEDVFRSLALKDSFTSALLKLMAEAEALDLRIGGIELLSQTKPPSPRPLGSLFGVPFTGREV